MVRFHTALAVLTSTVACGSGPASPKGGPAEPPTVVGEAQRDAAVDEIAPPPRLACSGDTNAIPGDDASWHCARADGTRHGPFVRLYPDGSIEVSGAYIDGALDGTWERRHPTGTVAERGAYAAGKKDGIWRQTSASGALLGEYTMQAGTGVEKRWYESGALYSELALRDGVPHGTAKQHAPEGGVLEISRYANGKLDGSRTTGTQRTLRIEESFQNGVRHGSRKIWQFHLLLAEENYDRAGRLDGAYTLWRTKKITRAKGEYDKGKRIGTWTWRDRADRKEREGAYAAGKRDGTWTEWWEGKPTFQGTYASGKPDGTFTYWDRAGNELGSFTIRGGTGTMQTFHGNRKPSSRTRLYKGLEDGRHEELSTRGKVLVEGYYRAGKKHGVWKEWTHDGVLVLEQAWARGRLDGVVKKYVGGKLSLEARYAEGKAEGPYVEYREGQPAVVGQFANDRRTGTWTHHDATGAVVVTATYLDGRLEGPYRQLVNGIVLDGQMQAGRRTGTWTKTDRNGRVQRVVYDAP